MVDGKNFFDQLVQSDMRIYDNIQKIATGQGDDYTKYRSNFYWRKFYQMLLEILMIKIIFCIN